jgi:hypothetical protein
MTYKIAVLISGEYRKFDICRRRMSFLDFDFVDVYVSTWAETTYICEKLNIRETIPVTEEEIRLVLNRSATVSVDSPKYTSGKYNSPMIDRWINGYNLIKNSNVDYDYIIVSRPDLFFHAMPNNLKWISNYEDSVGFAWAASSKFSKLSDVVIVSSFKKMSEIFESLSVDMWRNDHLEYDWHIWWHKFVTEKCQIKDLDELNNCTFCRYWVNADATSDDVVRVSHDWRDLKVLHQCDTWPEHKVKDTWSENIVMTAKAKWESGYFEKYLK